MLTAAERRAYAPLAAALRRAAAPGPSRLELVAGSVEPGAAAGLLAGTFNPLTRAHAALAAAAHRAGCERVVLAMAPRSLAKEAVERAHALDRLAWVRAWARRRPWAAVAVASHPLLVDMAEALRGLTGRRVALVMGADKAEQLTDPRWYGDPEAALERLARAAELLVAPRGAAGLPDLGLPARPLATPAWALERSSTEARAAAAAGRDLTPLLPAPVARAVRRTRAYDPDPAPYRARASALDGLLQAAAVLLDY